MKVFDWLKARFKRAAPFGISAACSLITRTGQATTMQQKKPGSLPALPAVLEGKLVYSQPTETDQTPVVHISSRFAGSAVFLTWLHDLSLNGVVPRVKPVSVRELDALTMTGHARKTAHDNRHFQMQVFANQLIADCAAVGGSDLHVLTREGFTEVQLRLKGSLKTLASHIYSMTREEGQALVRSIYTGLATVKDATFNPLEFQDAQISGEDLPSRDLSSVRIIRGPAHPVESGGRFLVARLQYPSNRTVNETERAAASARLGLRSPEKPEGEFRLGAMGYTPQQLEMIERLLFRPMGLIVVSGPTGSGKTTTLFECTRHQARLFPAQRLITIENPPEYPMEWALQLSTDSEGFSRMLRMTLRMDPDAILLGEVRGADEAIAALQAAMTGHKVMTTLHVTDPFDTFSRLEMLDHVQLARPVICNHHQIIGLISQRIVPLLCPRCSVPLHEVESTLPAYRLRALRSWGDLSRVRVRGNGCAHCNGESIVAQQAVAEVVVTDEQLMNDCIELGVHVARRNHRRKPGSDKTMIAHAMDLVLAGRIDPMDAEQQVDEIPLRMPTHEIPSSMEIQKELV